MIDPAEDLARGNKALDSKWLASSDPRFKDRIIGARGGYGPHQYLCSKCKARVHLADSAVAYSQENPEIPIVCYRCSKDDPPMKALPGWFNRLPGIIETVEALPRQQFDRDSIGVLFDLERSAAAKLLSQLGAEKIGGRYWISRKHLLLRLHRMQKIGSFQEAAARDNERRRKLAETVREAKEQHRARTIPIPVKPQSRFKTFGELDGTKLEPGRITVEFETSEEALVRLMELAWSVADDYDGFVQRVEVKNGMTA